MLTCYEAMAYLATMLTMDNFVGANGSVMESGEAYRAGGPSVTGLYYVVGLLVTMAVLLITTMIIIVKCPCY